MKIALIPARGGSKRIPRKNIKPFLGKPIIAYSIEAALNSGLFDEVIVSTDDQEIADVAASYGANVPFMRPAELSDDYATTVDVIKHAIDWYESKNTHPLSLICCLYATAPFITPESLKKGHDAIVKDGFHYAFAATEFNFPIQRAIKRQSNGAVEMFYPEHLMTRSQDLEPAYHDVGQFYWGKPEAFINNIPLYSKDAHAVLLSKHQSQDIDTQQDWDFAESLYTLLQRNEHTH